MGKENCVIEIMSDEYLRKRERVYFFKVASALKPYVAGSTSKSPTQQLLGFPFARGGGGQGGFCLSLSFAKMTQDIRRDEQGEMLQTANDCRRYGGRGGKERKAEG